MIMNTLNNMRLLLWGIVVIVAPGFFPLWYEYSCQIINEGQYL